MTAPDTTSSPSDTETRTGWWTIVRWGWYGPLTIAPPYGPWPTEDEARDALARWSKRVGWEAGSAIDAMHIAVVGPYRTREAARSTDISTYPEDIAESWGD